MRILSPKLREDSKEFDKKMYKNKLKDLEKAKKVIFSQKHFEVIEEEYNIKTALKLFVLKKKLSDPQIF